MLRIEDYRIVEAVSTARLTVFVQEWISQGYRIHGVPFLYKDCICQCMLKYAID